MSPTSPTSRVSGMSGMSGSHHGRLVLASTSRYRAALLQRLGLPFEVAAPDCDEQQVKDRGYPAEELVAELARRKAESVARRLAGDVAGSPSGALVLGCDQVAELDGEILGKPGTPERARAQLARLAGREHRLVTGICLLDGAPPAGARLEALDVHRLSVRPLTPEQIHRYVERDEPLDCAGSYKIESLGIALFESIQGADHTAIIGLPLTAVVGLLARCGVVVP